jgi:uncharacterized protein YjbI with pentapeptide repeats
LADAVFAGVKLQGARFSNINMKGVAIADADVSDAVFSDVNLQGARFSNVNLKGVAIDDANIEGLTIFGYDVQALIKAERLRRNGTDTP